MRRERGRHRRARLGAPAQGAGGEGAATGTAKEDGKTTRAREGRGERRRRRATRQGGDAAVTTQRDAQKPRVVRDAQVVREVDAVHDRVVVVLVGGGFARGG